MTVRTVYELDEIRIAQLHTLYLREWWTADRSLDETRRCVEGSQIRIGLTGDAGDLIGFVRVITDQGISEKSLSGLRSRWQAIDFSKSEALQTGAREIVQRLPVRSRRSYSTSSSPKRTAARGSAIA